MKKTILTFLIFSLCHMAWAEDIDLSIIARIESSGNPHAYNPRTKAVGVYQITPICLKDYNNHHKVKFTIQDMYNPDKAYIVANWYLNKRIPQMLRHYHITDVTRHRLICYNYGIGHLRKGDSLPIETKDYIKKYNYLKRRVK